MAGGHGIRDATRWWILVALGGALGIVLLDEVLVGIALPTIRDDLGLSQLLAQWVVNSYVLALTACVAAGGRLGDLLGHRSVFIAGAVILGVGSLGAGLAESAEWLISSRALQGVGGAIILSLSLAMIGIAFDESERGSAIGIYGMIAAVPAAAGPLIGGALTDLVSWRWIFLLNVPLAAVVALIVAVAWREPRAKSARTPFDHAGFTVLLLFLVPLVLALMQAQDWGWGSASVLILLAISLAGLALFIRVELRVSSPLIELELLRPPSVIGSNLAIFCAQFSKIAVLVFGPLYLQDRLGVSPLAAGTAMLAAMVPQLLTAVWSGQLTDRYGARGPALTGIATMVVALLWLAVFAPAETYLLVLPGLLLWGVSLPFLITPAYTTVMNAVAATQRGQASGVTSTGRQLGGTLAVPVLGAVLVSTESFAAVFAIAAVITAAVWCVAYLLIERPAGAAGRAVAPSPPL